jgi:hypothetical protein
MRLTPAVSEAEALDWLTSEAVARWGDVSDELRAALRTLAKAMAAVSSVSIPEDVEP